MIISAWNPEVENLEKTYIASPVQAGTKNISVKNADRMPQNSLILVGEMGMEQSELIKADTGGTQTSIVSTTNLLFSHTTDEPLYKMRYDQVLFYRASSIDGTYTLIATEEIDVDNRDNKTEYQDLGGTGSSFYKTKYRNSVTFEESEFSDTISAEGYARYSIGKVIDTTVKRLKDYSYSILSSDDYVAIANEVNDDITGQSERPYDFLKVSKLLDRVASQSYVNLPTNYFKFFRLEYTNSTNSVLGTRELKPISLKNISVGYNSMLKTDIITRVAIDDEAKRIVLGSIPLTNGTGAFKLWFFEDIGEFTELSDVVKTPNSLIYKYKFMAEFYSVKAETDPSFITLANKYEAKYGNELMKLQRYNRKDVGTDRSFMDSARTSSVSGYVGKVYKMR